MARYRFVSIVVLALGVLLAAGHGASAMEIVRQGKPACVIVIPEKPLPVVTAAARELQYHVREATGAELPITNDRGQETGDRGPGAGLPSPVSGRPAIHLGATKAALAAGIDGAKLEPNGFTIRLVGNALFLAGNDSDGEPFWILHNNRARVGTLFAVYEFLDRHLGCRWLWPGKLGEVIPRRADIRVDAWNKSYTPAFIHARWRDGGASWAGTQGWADPKARSRYLQDQGVWMRRQRFALGVNMDIHHAFTGYWGRFGKDRPELFNLLPDGTRRSDPSYYGGADTLISTCVSNPDFHRQIVEDWRAARTPDNPFIDASENDTCGRCTCERCLGWDVSDPAAPAPFGERADAARKAFAAGDADWTRFLGSLSDRYARFYLAVQKEAEKVDPQATVMGFAYANYVKPPLQTRLNERILIGIVPAMMYPWTPEKRKAFREQWDGWRATGVHLMLRPNYMLDGHDFPIAFARKLGEDFLYAAKRGMVATDFDSLTGQWATQGPNLYMLGRLTARPELGVDGVLDEYFAGFGRAGPAVRAYWDHWEKVSDAVTDERMEAAAKEKDPQGGSWARLYCTASLIFTPEVMARGRELLARAAKAAEGDGPAAQRVAFLEKGLRNAELTLAVQAAFERYKATGEITGYREAMGALDTFRAGVEGEDVANMGAIAWLESLTWDRKLLGLLKEPGTPLPVTWKFTWDPEKTGEAAGWGTEGFDDARWSEMRTDAPWEKQPAGEQWRKEHGADYDGVAWYRTRFEVKPAARPQQVRLIFGAVDEACAVWVNGKKLLERPYPYQGNTDSWREAFEVDVTGAVHDGANTLAVRVEDGEGAGGIWKPVWLLQCDAPAPAEANGIRDGGFEDPASGWGQSLMCGKIEMALDESVAHSGKRSARIRCTALDVPEVTKKMATRAWARWYRTGVKVEPGARYRLRAWVRTSPDFAGTLAMWATLAGKGTLEAKMLNTEGIWKELVIPDIVPETGDIGLYLNLMHGTGTVWVDDVELVKE